MSLFQGARLPHPPKYPFFLFIFDASWSSCWQHTIKQILCISSYQPPLLFCSPRVLFLYILHVFGNLKKKKTKFTKYFGKWRIRTFVYFSLPRERFTLQVSHLCYQFWRKNLQQPVLFSSSRSGITGIFHRKLSGQHPFTGLMPLLVRYRICNYCHLRKSLGFGLLNKSAGWRLLGALAAPRASQTAGFWFLLTSTYNQGG